MILADSRMRLVLIMKEGGNQRRINASTGHWFGVGSAQVEANLWPLSFILSLSPSPKSGVQPPQGPICPVNTVLD